MTNASFYIHLPTLKAAAICASTEEVRYYLKGVSLEFGAEGVTYAATDGHRLAAFHHSYFSDDGLIIDAEEAGWSAPSSFIVPLDLIKKVKLSKRGSDYARVSFDGSRVTIDYEGASVTSPGIDGTFPDWKRIVPDPAQSSAEIASFNYDYLASFEKIRELLEGKSGFAIDVLHNGNGPAFIDLRLSADSKIKGFGVCMPMRRNMGGEAVLTLPSWVRAADAPSAVAEAA